MVLKHDSSFLNAGDSKYEPQFPSFVLMLVIKRSDIILLM